MHKGGFEREMESRGHRGAVPVVPEVVAIIKGVEDGCRMPTLMMVMEGLGRCVIARGPCSRWCPPVLRFDFSFLTVDHDGSSLFFISTPRHQQLLGTSAGSNTL